MKACPIPSAHSRLNDFHRHWHQAADGYADAEAFRSFLNSALEASRNVTFALQSEGAKLADFDGWYSVRQQDLKADPIMKWLAEARTEVVHRKDLVTNSTAQARLVTWRSQPFLTVAVNPEVPTEAIAQLVASGEFPFMSPPDVAETVLEVERRWVAAGLPDHELLEALAHGYATLFRLLRDIHEREGSVIAACSKADRLHGTVATPMLIGDPLPCMLAQREARIIRVDLGQERPMEVTRLRPARKVDTKAARKALNRYGPMPLPRPEVLGDRAGEKTFELADSMWQQAKKILKCDRHHKPMALTLGDTGAVLARLGMPSQTAKYLVMRNVADQVRATGAVAVILIAETWTLTFAQWKGLRPQDDPERGEALILTVLTREIGDREYTVEFTRDVLGRIVFGTERVRDELPTAPLIWTPILEALSRKAEADAIKEHPEVGDVLEVRE